MIGLVMSPSTAPVKISLVFTAWELLRHKFCDGLAFRRQECMA